MADSFSKKIAEALDPSRKKTKVIKKKDTSSDREKELKGKEGKGSLTASERKELLKIVGERRAKK